MASNFGTSHARQREVIADQIVCKRLHVETSSTGGGIIGSGSAASFSSLTVTGTTTLQGALTSTSTLTTSSNMFCQNLTATGTVTANAVSTNSETVTTLTVGTTINSHPINVITNLTGGPPVAIAAGNVFPTLTIPVNTNTKYFYITGSSFSGQASNGTDPANPRGAPLSTAGAQITAFSDPNNLKDVWVFNDSPYSFFLAGSFPGASPIAKSRDAWVPRTWLHLSQPRGSSSYVREIEPIDYTSPLTVVSAAVLTSADATMGTYYLQYSARGTPGPNNTGILLSGTAHVQFTIAAPTDPVRITIPLPVGPNASVYPIGLALPNNGQFIADWVMPNAFHPSGTRPLIVGVGNIGANGSFTYDDATARVIMFVEPDAAGAGNATLVISGFTGGAGSYWASCPFSISLDYIQYRATYATF